MLIGVFERLASCRCDVGSKIWCMQSKDKWYCRRLIGRKVGGRKFGIELSDSFDYEKISFLHRGKRRHMKEVQIDACNRIRMIY